MCVCVCVFVDKTCLLRRQVVEWLIKHTHHLPSDEICHKILMSAVDCKDKENLLQKRSKCLALIQEVMYALLLLGFLY